MKISNHLPQRPDRLRLPGFDYSSAGTYFLTICARDKQPVFNNAAKRLLVKKTAIECAISLNMSVIAMCIMLDHIHVLLYNSLDLNASVGDFIRIFKSKLYKEFRHFFGLKHSFWQRNYYDHIIRDDRDFDEKFQYIMNNLIKAGLTAHECDPEFVYINFDKLAGRGKPPEGAGDPYAGI